MCCVLPAQPWQPWCHTDLWALLCELHWTVTSQLQRTWVLRHLWSQSLCSVLAFGNICWTGFLFRYSFLSLGSVRLRAESRILLTLWRLRPGGLKRTNSLNKVESEVSCASFLSSQHRRNPLIFGLLLRHEPLCFFLYFPRSLRVLFGSSCQLCRWWVLHLPPSWRGLRSLPINCEQQKSVTDNY